MKLWIVLGFASLLLAFTQAAPLQEHLNGEAEDALILDKIGINIEEVKAILKELAQHGLNAAIELAKKFLEHASGALKDLLVKLLETLERQKSAFILDIIGINIEQVKAILKELAEHGKQAAIELAKKLLEHAGGALKDLLVKVLEWLEKRGDSDVYILDIIGINIDQVKAILKELAEHGKQAAIALAKKLLESASGILKDLLVKVLEWLENRNDVYILDKIGINIEQVKAILKELAEHGKQAAIALAKKLLEHASGILKDLLVKVLEMLEKRNDDAFILDIIGINVEQVKAILKELAEHGKQAAIELAKKFLEHATGALKDLLVKVLEWLEKRNDDAFILGINIEQVKTILKVLAEHGKQAAIELAKKMIQEATGLLKDTLVKVLEWLETKA